MHVVMILQSCGNLAFAWEFLANRLKSMCLRDDHLVCLFIRLLVSSFFVCLCVCSFVSLFVCFAWRYLASLVLRVVSYLCWRCLSLLALLSVACFLLGVI